MTEISRLNLKNVVLAHTRAAFPEEDLDGLKMVTVYDGAPGVEPSYMPPTIDEHGHIRPYIVLETSPGSPADDIDLAELHNDLDWQFSIKGVAAYQSDLNDLFDRIVPIFRAWHPDLGEDLRDLVEVGRCRQLNVPGPHLIDRSPTPDRLYNVLQYGLQLTT